MKPRRKYNPPVGTKSGEKSKVGPDIDDWEFTDVVALAVRMGRSLLPCESVIHVDGNPYNNHADNLEVNQENCNVQA